MKWNLIKRFAKGRKKDQIFRKKRRKVIVLFGKDVIIKKNNPFPWMKQGLRYFRKGRGKNGRSGKENRGNERRGKRNGRKKKG